MEIISSGNVEKNTNIRMNCFPIHHNWTTWSLEKDLPKHGGRSILRLNYDDGGPGNKGSVTAFISDIQHELKNGLGFQSSDNNLNNVVNELPLEKRSGWSSLPSQKKPGGARKSLRKRKSKKSRKGKSKKNRRKSNRRR
tara:strand:+ start:1102 stop:1518 length:417 start_codon:yes stop_codon:yes gene_type:complete